MFLGEPIEKIADRFAEALTGKHGAIIQEALDGLMATFGDTAEVEGYLRDGPTRAAQFEIEGDSREDRERRLVRQRDFAGIVNALLSEIAKRRATAAST